MKIFHTGDWHIGKIINQVHMTADQEYALWRLVKLMEAENPDVLIIAGDVYDRAIPPVEAVELLDKILSTILLELNIPVLIVAGNHDSPDRLAFGSSILKAKGLHIAGRLQPEIKPITLKDNYGPVNFYLVPYAPPSLIKEILGKDDIVDHNNALSAIIEAIKQQWSPTERNVLVYHGFVRGVEEVEFCESEKPLSLMSLGGADYVDAAHFKDFTYTALGHLHRPQRAGYDHIRYAGSLLKYSFSEVAHTKAVTIVQIGPTGELATEFKTLQPLRDMRKIKGQLQALLDPQVYEGTNVEDYLHVTLTDEGELLEPMAKLRQIYPNVLALELESKERQAGEDKTSAGEGYRQKSKLDLFRDFYCDLTGLEFSAEKERILAEVIAAVETEERGA
ncbi:MAG: exonuclease SbcCD subunit D [Peptococcaceae bacterium]|jgi:exonuclease SbcD|nr:exonuclease SbcCD subunit D [Peptococcaceae bacterium]